MMKRILICIVFFVLLAPLQAQVPDEVVASSADLQYEDDVNVSPSIRPALKSLKGGIEYSRFFFEGIMALQRQGSLGLGASFAYLPKWIGAYATAVAYESHSMYTVGPTFRPLAGIIGVDWQLYGGMAYASPITRHFDNRFGFEIGTRFAPSANNSRGQFAWWSLSLSRLYVNKQTYYTLGLSINLIALSGLWIVL